MDRVKLQAHKGIECEYPENTMVSFRAAAAEGYEMIELDPHMTKDGVFVVLHNSTINHTARLEDGSELPSEVAIADITFEESQKYDFGIFKGEKFKGERIPKFEEVLRFAAERDIMLKIDNKLGEQKPQDRVRFYELIKETGAKVCISSWNYECAYEIRHYLPDCDISFDGLSDEGQLKLLRDLIGADKFSVWLPIDREGASWAPKEWFATPEKADVVRRYAKLCLWAVYTPELFFEVARQYRPYAVETVGNIKPHHVDEL